MKEYIVVVILSLVDFIQLKREDKTILVHSPAATVLPTDRAEGTTEYIIVQLVNNKRGASVITELVKGCRSSTITRAS